MLLQAQLVKPPSVVYTTTENVQESISIPKAAGTVTSTNVQPNNTLFTAGL